MDSPPGNASGVKEASRLDAADSQAQAGHAGRRMRSMAAVALLALMLLGLGLRHHHLTHRSLMNDEVIVLWGAQGRLDGGVLKSAARIASAEAVLNHPWMPTIAKVFACNIAYMDVPPGYFLGMYAWLSLFSPSEYTLRLPAMIGGILAILAIYLCARRFVSREAALVAAALATLAPTQVIWSQENREYSWTVLLATLVLWRSFAFAESSTYRNAKFVALVGAMAVFLQYGLVILLAAVYVFMGLRHLRRPFPKEAWRRWRISQVCIGAMLVVTAVTALLPQLYFHRHEHLAELFSDGTLRGAIHYVVSKTLAWPGYIHGPVLQSMAWAAWLPAVLFLAGLAAAAVSKRGRPLLLLFVIAMTATAAGGIAGYYPYGPTRHCLFLSPFFFLIVAFLFEAAFRRIPEGQRFFAGLLFVAGLAGLGGWHVWNAPVYDGPAWRNVRPVAQYLAEHRKPGETIHASHLAYPPLDFYLNPAARTVVSHRFPENFRADEAYARECLAGLPRDRSAWLVLGDMDPRQQKGVRDALKLLVNVEESFSVRGVWLLRLTPLPS